MVTNRYNWNPLDPSAWAKALGLVNIPAFGGHKGRPLGEHAVMLDGDKASFLMSVTEDKELVFGEKPLSWSWSANLRHLLVIDKPAKEMFLRRWDTPAGSMRRFRLADRPQAALDLLNILEKAPAPRTEDVILFALRAFRIVRNSLLSSDGLDSIQVFNLLLTGAEAVCQEQIKENNWSNCRTVNDALRCLKDVESFPSELCDLPKKTKEAVLDEELFRYFLRPEPATGCRLAPDLLLRHASGQLYQEAHLRLEYECRQAFLPGMASDASPGGLLTKDVRFTPPSLARMLVEQSLNAAKGRIKEGLSAKLEILDPACGSGVFLQEALRELARRAYKGKIALRGFDTSPISCAISRFCLERIKQDLPASKVSIDIKEQDSLLTDWGTPDLILMNPPFMPWHRLKETNQEDVVKQVLGENLAKGRVDLAMAFIWKAVKSLAPDASLATVLPAPLFETDSGEKWRYAIKSRAELLLLGRFAGYGFFRGSTVEPGMLVVRGKDTQSVPRQEPAIVRVLVAKSGSEDAAIRGLRRDSAISALPTEWDVFTVQEPTLSTASWMPRFRDSMQLVEILTAAGMTKVENLFTVHQGIRTGYNKAFVLSAEEHKNLPKNERDYFKPTATNSTIRDGVISPDKFVFFPYSGRTIDTEEELKKRVPRYYKKRLRPAKDDLAARRGIDASRWWLLTWPRSWQIRNHPKLTTTYFGYRGSFAYDDSGEFVVLQGYAWLWKREERKIRPAFDRSPLPWAYLAILNSRVFETLLESACPRVQGGQFNLSTKFVNDVFLPDLADNARYAGSLVEKLAKLGRQIHKGTMPELDVIDELAAQAYGMPVDRLVQDFIF